MATISYVAAASLALFVFAALANLIVMQYAGGVLRAAIDEGARQGAVKGAGPAECLVRIDEVLNGLLGGSYGAGVTRDCVDEGGWVRATATGVWRGFVPFVPDVSVSFEASAAREDP